MFIDKIFPEEARKQCKQSVLDKNILFEYEDDSDRREELGEFYFPEEKRQGEKPEDIEALKKEIDEQLSKCHNTEEEINLLRNIIYELKRDSKTWAKLETKWDKTEEVFLNEQSRELNSEFAKMKEDPSKFRKKIIGEYKENSDKEIIRHYRKKLRNELSGKKLKRELAKVKSDLGSFREKIIKELEYKSDEELIAECERRLGNDLIANYKSRVRTHFQARNKKRRGPLFCEKMKEWLAKELDYRQKRGLEYKNRYNTKKFEDIFDLHPATDKIPWVGFGKSNNDKGQVELIYLLERLFDLGLIDISKKDIRDIAFNFFEMKKTGLVNKNSFITTQLQMVSQPDDLQSRKDKPEVFSSIILSKIDIKTHQKFLQACERKDSNYQTLSLEEGLEKALKHFSEYAEEIISGREISFSS